MMALIDKTVFENKRGEIAKGLIFDVKDMGNDIMTVTANTMPGNYTGKTGRKVRRGLLWGVLEFSYNFKGNEVNKKPISRFQVYRYTKLKQDNPAWIASKIRSNSDKKGERTRFIMRSRLRKYISGIRFKITSTGGFIDGTGS